MTFVDRLEEHKKLLTSQIRAWKNEDCFHECSCNRCTLLEDEVGDDDMVDGARSHYTELIVEAERTLKLLEYYENKKEVA